MHTFEIIVQRKLESQNTWPIVVIESESGVFLPIRIESQLDLDLDHLRSQASPLDYGMVLGRAVFRDNVQIAFSQARAKGQNHLRVLLSIEDDELKTLYWGRLCAPLAGNRWDFLVLDQSVPFSIYLPSQTDRRFPPIGQHDLRALIVVAKPDNLSEYNLSDFDTSNTASTIQTALGEIPYAILGTVEGAVGLPTLDQICRRITDEHYTLLHITAHGRVARGTGETVLFLADDKNRVDAVTDTRLLTRLARLQGAKGLPHFVFLSTCESAKPEAEDALGGLGQRLVRELGIPAVLAMTERISLVTARALNSGFYSQLRQHGEVDRALVEACAGLAERHDVTVPVLYSRLGGRPLFSDKLERTLTALEVKSGLGQLEMLLPERAPVLLDEFTAQAITLRDLLTVDQTALSQTARAECEQALTVVNAICEEVLDLNFRALALGQKPPGYDSRVPFRGLSPFRSEDQAFFFGREPLVAKLVEKLTRHNFLAVLGPSGSGKSSLVFAGLVPSLQEQRPALQLAGLTPGADPVAQLAVALSGLDLNNALLVIDQFEEIFTLCPDEEQRRKFIDRILELNKTMPVVITMRADFWGECAPYETLREAMQANQELISSMTTVELRRAMERQAARVGLRFESDLGNIIFDDVRGEPGAMPLLQHALLELWQRRHGRWLLVKEYRIIGGVQQAIAETAEAFYNQLSSEEADWVKTIFMRLTHLDENAEPGEESRDTRRRVEMDDLVLAQVDPAAITNLVQRLAGARLVVTSVNKATGRHEVEVVHEALIRHWPRLQTWLNENRQWLPYHRQLSEAVHDWQTYDRHKSYLVHGLRLKQMQTLVPSEVLTEAEQTFLQASRRFDNRQKIIRFAAIAVGIFILAGLIWNIWQAKPWTYLPLSPAPPAITPPITMNLSTDEPSGNNAEAWRNSLNKRQAAWVEDPAQADMQIDVQAVSGAGGVHAVTITLPVTPAYKLDFLPEIRDLKGDVPTGQIPALLRAAVAYSLGDYPAVVEQLGRDEILSQSGYILRAQAQLFEDNWLKSRQDYKEAIALVKDDPELEARLLAGLALAYWRPVLLIGDDNAIYRDQCQTALEYYESVLDLNPEGKDWPILVEIARFYCFFVSDDYAERYWQGQILTSTARQEANENLVALFEGLMLRDFGQLRDDADEIKDLAIETFQQANDEFTIANKELTEIFLDRENGCLEASEARLVYRQQVYTKLDLSNVQWLIRHLCP